MPRQLLNETCVVCGFCHRLDTDAGVSRPSHPRMHFHWESDRPEAVRGDHVAHRTVCAEHFAAVARLYPIGRAALQPRYHVPGSLNAPLPTEHLPQATLNRLNFLYDRMFELYDAGFIRAPLYAHQDVVF